MLVTCVFILSRPILSYREFTATRIIQLNNRRFLLSVLCVLSIFWANGCIFRFLQNKSSKLLIFLLLILFLSLQLFFFVRKILFLYVIFELSVLPIFGIIIGWGYQRERLNASLSLIFYTLSASMPFLAILLWALSYNYCDNLNCFRSISHINYSSLSALVVFCLSMAFAVKLPMFGVHIWLPKAHVEAPVFGSIILASILLKLGSYGLWLFTPLFHFLGNANILVSIRMIGAAVIRATCLRLRDIKIIIAYSSVSHMGLVLIALFIIQPLSNYGGLLIMLAHGVRSSAIFLFSYYLYQINFSRRIILKKGVLVWSGTLPLLWFLILIINMAAPPTFNLISEILIISSIVGMRVHNILPLTFIIILSTAYSLIMFSSTMQGRTVAVINVYQLRVPEMFNTRNHIIWGIFMVFAVGLANF